jgi:hypothetical protein
VTLFQVPFDVPLPIHTLRFDIASSQHKRDHSPTKPLETLINFAVFGESRDQPEFEHDLNTLSDSVNKFFAGDFPGFCRTNHLSDQSNEGALLVRPAVAGESCRIEAVDSVFQSVKKRKGGTPNTRWKISLSARMNGFIWGPRRTKQSSTHLYPTPLSYLIFDTSDPVPSS